MSNKENKNLLNKYLEAESSLEEEKQLLDGQNNDPAMDSWFRFVNESKTKVPAGLNDKILASIESRNKSKHRFMNWGYGIAASIALIVGVFFFQSRENDDYLEKEALLNEALSMFPEPEQQDTDRTILYEDEMIIIYVASNE